MLDTSGFKNSEVNEFIFLNIECPIILADTEYIYIYIYMNARLLQ